jgi:hypothetical protein
VLLCTGLLCFLSWALKCTVPLIKSSIGVVVLLYGLALFALVGIRVYCAHDGGVFSSAGWRLWVGALVYGLALEGGKSVRGAKVALGWAFLYSEPTGVWYSTVWGAGALCSIVLCCDPSFGLHRVPGAS